MDLASYITKRHLAIYVEFYLHPWKAIYFVMEGKNVAFKLQKQLD